MERRLFGTDGIRGTANTHPMTAEVALSLGKAAGKLFRRGGQPDRVVIGKDTRLSGYLFEPALTAGFTSVGMNVLLLGPMPTAPGALLPRGGVLLVRHERPAARAAPPPRRGLPHPLAAGRPRRRGLGLARPVPG